MYSSSNLIDRNYSSTVRVASRSKQKLPQKSTVLTKSTQVVFIDRQLTDYEILAAGVLPDFEVYLLDPDLDGIRQITQVLATRRLIDTIHLVSHGSAGRIQLGSADLSVESIDPLSAINLSGN